MPKPPRVLLALVRLKKFSNMPNWLDFGTFLPYCMSAFSVIETSLDLPKAVQDISRMGRPKMQPLSIIRIAVC